MEYEKIVGANDASYDHFYDKIVNVQGLKMANPATDKLSNVKTCRQYIPLKKANFYVDALGERMEGDFIKNCRGLEIFRTSQEFETNLFQSDFNSINKQDFTSLPKTIYDVTVFTESLCPAESSLQVCLNKAGASLTFEGNQIIYDSRSVSGKFTPMIIGDFNGDGYADMALFYEVGIKRGALMNHGYICLEKTEDHTFEINCPDEKE